MGPGVSFSPILKINRLKVLSLSHRREDRGSINPNRNPVFYLILSLMHGAK